MDLKGEEACNRGLNGLKKWTYIKGNREGLRKGEKRKQEKETEWVRKNRNWKGEKARTGMWQALFVWGKNTVNTVWILYCFLCFSHMWVSVCVHAWLCMRVGVCYGSHYSEWRFGINLWRSTPLPFAQSAHTSSTDTHIFTLPLTHIH